MTNTKTKAHITPLTLICAGFGIAVMVLLILSIFGVLNNFLGWDAQQTAIFPWKILSLLLLAVAGVYIYRLITGRYDVQRNAGWVLLILLGLAVGSATGFKSTAGDIGQRISAFNADGTLGNKSVLFEYYSDFYHLDTDTALVNYINTYNELPGINCYNVYRATWLRGDTVNGIRPSVAPRANECDFKIHSHMDNKNARRGAGIK